MPEPTRERTGSAQGCLSAPRGTQRACRRGGGADVPFQPQLCTAAFLEKQVSREQRARANLGTAHAAVSLGTALRRRGSRDNSTEYGRAVHEKAQRMRQWFKKKKTKKPHTTTRALDSAPNGACAGFCPPRRMRLSVPRNAHVPSALRTRQLQERIGHARPFAPLCACASLGTAMRMLSSRPQNACAIVCSAHAASMSPNCACGRLGTALRMRFSRADYGVRSFSGTHLRVRFFRRLIAQAAGARSA